VHGRGRATSSHGVKRQRPATVSAERRLTALTAPYEARANKKQRFAILGQRVKGAERNVALARGNAVERRNNTLLEELKATQKSNSFVDRRFGEKDGTLDGETKALVRFQKERLRQLKVSKRGRKFNLEGAPGGEDAQQLTHAGRALSDLDAFNAPPSDGFEDEGAGGPKRVDPLDDINLRFGGGEGEEEDAPAWRGKMPVPAWQEEKRSYKEIMEEVIGKSKAARVDRAREKEEAEAALARLDAQHATVIRLMGKGAGRKGAQAEFEAAMREDAQVLDVDFTGPSARGGATDSHGGSRAPTLAPVQPAATAGIGSAMSYNVLVRALAGHSRAAAASNRTKTAEEVAEEEAARLKELEGLRRVRARGGAEGSASGEHGGGDDLGPWDVTGVTARQARAKRGGISLEEHVEEFRKGREGAAEDAEDEEEGDDSEEEEGEGEEEEEDDDSEEEGEEDGDDPMGDENDDCDEILPPPQLEEEEVRPVKVKAAGKAKAAAGEPEELPFTLAMPEDHDAYEGLLAAYAQPHRRAMVGAEEAAGAVVDEMIRRLRALHALALGAGNGGLLGRLYGLLLSEVVVVGDGVAPGASLATWRLTAAVRHLNEMSAEKGVRRNAGGPWRQAIGAMSERLSTALAAGPPAGAPPARPLAAAAAASGPSSAGWPSGGELLLSSLARSLFPLSDFRHTLLLPMSLTLASSLAQAPVVVLMDVARGALTAAACADLLLPGRRAVPELTTWLASVLAAYAGVGCGGTPSGLAGQATALRVSAPQPTFGPFLRSVTSGALVSAAVAYERSHPGTAPALPLSLTGLGLHKRGGGLTEGQLAAGILHATLLSVRALSAALVPDAFMAASPERRALLTQAALAPAGDAAHTVRAAGGSAAAAAVALPLHAHVDCPSLTAPEVLDPLIGAATLALAQAEGAIRKAGAGAGTASLPLAADLSATLKGLVAQRDAVAACRGPMRLHEDARPAAVTRTLAPLLEDVNAPTNSTHLQAQLAAAGVPARKAAATVAGANEAKEREEVRKLQRSVKREKRGAMRELRRDREAVVRAQDATRKARDAERSVRGKELRGELEAQAHTANLLSGKRKAKPVPGGNGAATKKENIAEKMPWLLSTGKTKADRRARKEGPGGGSGKSARGKGGSK